MPYVLNIIKPMFHHHSHASLSNGFILKMQVFHGMKHSPQEHAYRREELVKSGINGDDAEDELMYHIDYHGVTTHPSPTPKHGKP